MVGKSRFCCQPRLRGQRLDLSPKIQQIAAQTLRDLHAQFGELEKLSSKLSLLPEEEDGCKRCGDGYQP